MDEHNVCRLLVSSTVSYTVLIPCSSRCATTGLILVLGYLYPSYLFLFQLVVVLNISSHWMLACSFIIKGDSSHKVTENVFLKIYYMEPVLSVICGGSELFFISLYIAYFNVGPQSELISSLIVCTHICT